MFESILVPVDGSGPSNAAVNVALGLAHERKAQITFVHAYDVIGEVGMAPHANLGLAEQVAEDQASDILAAATAAAKRAGVKSVAKTLEGNVVEEILREAKATGASIIVVGSHGRTGLSRALLGSVSEGIARRSDIPVLTVHAPKDEKAPHECGKWITIL